MTQYKDVVEKQNQTNTLANTPAVINEFEKLNDNSHSVPQSIKQLLTNIKINDKLHNIYFITKSGDIKFSLHPTDNTNTNI